MIYNESKYNSHWDTKKLNELGTFDRGKSRHRPRDDKRLFENGKYPLIQTGEVKAANLYVTSHKAAYSDFGLAQSKLWPKGTLCITIAANIAETALLGYPMCFPDSVIGFNAFPDKSSELFMHYVFTYIRKSIQNSTGGSIQDNINKEYLEGLDFKIPPKPYQDKIVKILSSIDRKIDLNKKMNNELEELAKSIYDYWFVQFNFPNEEGKPFKSSGGKIIWNEEIKREIPEGWQVKSLGEIERNIITGKTPSTKIDDYYNGEIPFITIGDIRGNVYITNTEITLTKEGANSQSNKYIPEGSICVSCIATPGLVGFTVKTAQTNQQINTVVCEVKENEKYLYFAIKDYFNYSSGAKKGNTFPNMSKGDFSDILLVYPNDMNLLKEFSNSVEYIFDLIKKNSLENDELFKLRDWILPMLMTGQVTI